MLARGSFIGRYLVLGPAASGEAYLGHDPELDRKVTLKLLPAASDEERQRLQREATAMARLSHPGVVTVYDVGSQDDRLYVAMEHVGGRSLAEWLGQRKRGWREIARVFLDAGRGLIAAHRTGVVHRDFKADSIIVGDDGRVRVTDFGLRGEAGAAARVDTADFVRALTDALDGVPRVPARIRRALLRDDLEALVAELARDPGRTLRRALLAVTGAVLLAGLLYAVSREDPGAACRGAEGKLAGIWDPSRKQAVESAFLATRSAGAAAAWGTTERLLDGYSRTWLSMHDQVCQAARVRHQLSEEDYDMRLECLMQRAQDLRRLTHVLLGADARSLDHAAAAAEGLPDLGTCADDATLRVRRGQPCDLGVPSGERCRGRAETIKVARLATGWTGFVALEPTGELLAYDRASGEAAVLVAAADGSLGVRRRLLWKKGWTHLARATLEGKPHLLPYDSSTGEVEVTVLDEAGLRSVAAARWSPGLTAVVPISVAGAEYLLAYDGAAGAATWNAIQPDGRLIELAHHQLEAGLTHFVPYLREGTRHVFAYDVTRGDIQMIRVGGDGAFTVVERDAWSPGWTAMMQLDSSAPNLLAYKAGDGRWEVDELQESGRVVTRRKPGYTSVVAFRLNGRPHALAYRKDTGEYFVDRFDL